MTYQMRTSDHLFEAFLASAGEATFTGIELVMFKFFQRHPGMEAMRAAESAMVAYAKRKRK